MRRARFIETLLMVLSTAQISFTAPQSLAEAARKEAERRKALEQQGIEGKVLSVDSDHATRENPADVSPLPSKRAKPDGARTQAHEPSLRTLRATLQKLDREILRGEERLTLLRARMESARWQLPKVGKISRNNNASLSERLRVQIQDLEAKVKQWRRERYETYDVGRKAGYLPGELDGKSVTP